MLIGILGNKYHGKDTIADYLVSKYMCIKMALADPLKKACAELFGFSAEQLAIDKENIDPKWGVSPRVILQYLGTDIFRNDIQRIMPNIGEDFWIRKLINDYNNIILKKPATTVVISDVRFQNEIDHIHKNGGVIIKVIRPDIKINDQHISEKNIQYLNGDYEIINDSSLEDLYLKIDKIIDDIIDNRKV